MRSACCARAMRGVDARAAAPPSSERRVMAEALLAWAVMSRAYGATLTAPDDRRTIRYATIAQSGPAPGKGHSHACQHPSPPDAQGTRHHRRPGRLRRLLRSSHSGRRVTLRLYDARGLGRSVD